jgi:GNAT superfamily N-acetyltransferase
MTPTPDVVTRRADAADADAIARLLHDFNTEYDEPTPGPNALAARLRELFAASEITVVLAGDGPDGLGLLRFRPSLWKPALDCYLEELYVVPHLRGRGIGRVLMEAVIDVARDEGAGDMHLGTSDDDIAARALYESLGFTNREHPPDGPIQYFYEREL